MRTERILIASADRPDALDLQQRITQLGYPVLALATSSHEALRLAATLRPDVVVMDLRLPGLLDGLQAGTHIWVTLDIPVIYLSEHFPERTLQRLWPTCPAGLLWKGTAPQDLHRALAACVARRAPPRVPHPPRGVDTLPRLPDLTDARPRRLTNHPSRESS